MGVTYWKNWFFWDPPPGDPPPPTPPPPPPCVECIHLAGQPGPVGCPDLTCKTPHQVGLDIAWSGKCGGCSPVYDFNVPGGTRVLGNPPSELTAFQVQPCEWRARWSQLSQRCTSGDTFGAPWSAVVEVVDGATINAIQGFFGPCNPGAATPGVPYWAVTVGQDATLGNPLGGPVAGYAFDIGFFGFAPVPTLTSAPVFITNRVVACTLGNATAHRGYCQAYAHFQGGSLFLYPCVSLGA